MQNNVGEMPPTEDVCVDEPTDAESAAELATRTMEQAEATMSDE